VNGTVNANGSSTQVYFQWGTTVALGHTSSSQFIGGGTTAVTVSIPISGLTSDTTYYGQIVAASTAGTLAFPVSVFKTAPDATALPDIIVLSLRSTTTGVPGGQIPIELIIKNAGSGDAGVFRASFYLSADTVIDTTDVYTGWVCNFDSGLKAGNSTTCSGSIGIPSNVAPGTYVLGVIADNRAELVESNRQNNARTADTGPLAVIAANSIPSQVDTSIADRGAAAFSTLGTSGNTQAGYAIADVIYGSAPYGTAVFSLVQNGIAVSEAGVPASPPTRQARVFIDYRPMVVIGTPPNASTIGVSTGIAVANRASGTANLTFQLRDVSGNPIGSIGHGTLAAGAHAARFVSEISRIAPDFVLPTNFTGFGSLDINSDQLISVVALRLTTNQRNETLLTTTPIADLAGQLKYQSVYFPQVVDGGGYRTLITLMNTSNSTESGRVVFFDYLGSALNVKPDGGGSSSSYSYRINAGGVFTLLTDGSPTSTNAGSVQVIPDATNAVPVGAAVISYSAGGVLVTESGIPATVPTTHARVYVDRSKGHDTGIAIAGANSAPSISLAAYQADGITPAGTGSSFNLSSNGHAAAFAGQLVSALPAGFIGVLDISAPQPFVALTLRSLVNGRNDFLLTTFPIADFNQPAPSPIVFPQIADGGGYATQFIFLSPGGSLALTTKLFDDSGRPLALRTAIQ
jgi:hypothetical protein